jgi:hypothetical protein
VNFINCFRCLVINSCLFIGQILCFDVSLFSVSLGCCRRMQRYIRLSVVCSSLPLEHIALSSSLNCLLLSFQQYYHNTKKIIANYYTKNTRIFNFTSINEKIQAFFPVNEKSRYFLLWSKYLYFHPISNKSRDFLYYEKITCNFILLITSSGTFSIK